MKSPNIPTVLSALIVMVLVGCYSDNAAITGTSSQSDSIEFELGRLEATPMAAASQPPPSGLVTVNLGPEQLEFWPYTGTNFSGQPQDPINLIFFGEADPRDIRAALLSLDGDRSAFGFPPAAPFNSGWDDTFGDVQTAFGADAGWTGVVVQLEAGSYQDARFHLRLFKVGRWTVGGAHFEIRIPGTTEHQVISWELAEQFVMADMIRSGLLDPSTPMVPTSQINGSPFRTIPAVVYNGLPVELKSLVGGPLGDVTADVPIETDGHAMILNLSQKVDRVAETRIREFVIEFDQVIPKPFCASGPMDYVLAQGPVYFTQEAIQSEDGSFRVDVEARGTLTVVPVNPLTGEPSGPALTAEVFEQHKGTLSDRGAKASSTQRQILGHKEDPGSGFLLVRLRVGSHGDGKYKAIVRCSSSPETELYDESPTDESMIPNLLAHSTQSQ